MCSVAGLIVALALTCSAAVAQSESRAKKSSRDAREAGTFRSATAPGNLNGFQTEKEGNPQLEASDQPIDINAKKVVARKTSSGQEITFEGSVKAKQGNVILTCDRLVVIYEKKKDGSEPQDRSKKNPKELKEASVFKSATASGNVKVVQNEKVALAGKAVFDSARKTITLTENPKVWVGPDSMTASAIVIYVDEDRVEMVNGGGTINPGKKEKEK